MFKVFLIISSLFIADTLALADEDRVTSIPNYKGDFCWKHWSGYLNATSDHQLFYWYHEATIDPETKPLVLWLNGGPGCSSLGGMFTEIQAF